MRFRYVEKSERFQKKAKHARKAHPAFDEILDSAILYLESELHLTTCRVVGGGATQVLYCLPSNKTAAFPSVNFFFSFDSRENEKDTVILHDLFIEENGG